MSTPTTTRRTFLSTLACAIALPPAITHAAAPSHLKIFFNGTQYLHRWQKEGQHEFTPEAETDLQRWHNMLTINLHRAATDGEKLADIANRIAGNTRQHGRILKTASRPAIASQPAEHLIAAVFGRPSFLEAAFTRVHQVKNTGFATTYSHRIYGEKVGPAMSQWLAANGEKTESALMNWSDPAVLATIAAA